MTIDSPDSIKIAAGINTYANPEHLERTLSTIQAIDQRFVIHGRYPTYKYVDPQSLHRTRQVCDKFANTQLVDLNAHEIDKRNRYLELAKDYDFLIVIDNDEYVPPQISDWSTFRKGLFSAIFECPGAQVFDIYFGGPISESGARPRIFYKPSTIKYWEKHFWWITEDRRLLKGRSDSAKLIEGVVLLHDRSNKSEEYRNARKEYGQWLMYNEIAVV